MIFEIIKRKVILLVSAKCVSNFRNAIPIHRVETKAGLGEETQGMDTGSLLFKFQTQLSHDQYFVPTYQHRKKCDGTHR